MAAEVLVGGLAYLLTLMVFHRDRVSVFWNVAKMIRNPVQGKTAIEETAPI